MQMTPSNRNDAAIDQFRQLANSTDEDLALEFSQARRAWLGRFITEELVNFAQPLAASPEDFVRQVRLLQDSKQKWSRYYGDLVIALHSDDLESKQQALDSLHQVATECPWLFLRRSAVSRLP
jgi:hypothetical protein